MSYNPVSFRNLTPVEGYWLADFPNSSANIFFDITDLNTYPEDLPMELKIQIRSEIKYLPVSQKTVKSIDYDNPSAQYSLLKIVGLLREWMAKQQGCLANIPTESDERYANFASRLPKEKLQKRLFYLYVANLVVSGAETTGSAAARFGLDKCNVAIWVSILISFGQEAFFRPERRFSPNEEKQILKNHHDYKRTVAQSCARNHIFCASSFRHMRRRQKKRERQERGEVAPRSIASLRL